MSLKEIYWKHFTEEIEHPKFMTQTRLAKVLPFIWRDKDFWQDVLDRHAGGRLPEKLKADSPEHYEHCFSNMIGMTVQIMMENKIWKP